MSTCPNCAIAATVWHWGGFTDGCGGCLARSMARMPQHLRRDLYTLFHAQHKDMAKLRALQTQVKAEHERIAALRAQQSEAA